MQTSGRALLSIKSVSDLGENQSSPRTSDDKRASKALITPAEKKIKKITSKMSFHFPYRN